MNIQPAYVTFEQAKRLKEKGFNLLCFYYYENKILKEPYLENGSSTDTEFKVNLSDLLEYFNKHSELISAPEQWQVIEWLRSNHEIWVVAFPELLNGNIVRYYPSIFQKGVGEDIEQYFDTPQEAYSAAFDYILKQLI
jgi:transposase